MLDWKNRTADARDGAAGTANTSSSPSTGRLAVRSFAGLLAYPLLVEPLLPLGAQSLAWAVAPGEDSSLLDEINAFIKKHKRHVKTFLKPSSAGNRLPAGQGKRKTEVLVANYPI